MRLRLIMAGKAKRRVMRHRDPGKIDLALARPLAKGGHDLARDPRT